MRADPRPLVGRLPELAAIDRLLQEAGSAPASVLEVGGEPGIGKTRLLAELAERAERRGFQVHSGRGAELERGAPFGLLVDALDSLAAKLDAGILNSLGADARSRLGAVFPSLAHLGPAGPAAGAERHRAHRAIRSLLELLSRRRPLALLLDDVHWADEASLELLAHLMHRPPETPLAIAYALRPAQAPAVLTAAVHDAERSGSAERIALGPLTPAEADELLGTGLHPHVRRALYRESGGNPFYLEQLARSAARSAAGARPAGDDAGAETGVPGVPEVVTAALADEIHLLPERVRLVARAAAALGETFEPELVAEVARLPVDGVIADLDELIARDLVRPAAPALFSFRHPIVRRAVYDSAPAAWLVAAHRHAATALEARQASALQRAHHEERSATKGDERAIAVLHEAGTANMTLAPATAARFLAAALRLLPDGAPIERRISLLVPLATALGTAGALEESRESLREILTLLPAGEAASVQVVALMAAIDHLLGRYEEANAFMMGTLERLPSGPSTEGTALLLELAAGRYFEGDWDPMGEHAAHARRFASECGERAYEAEAESMLVLSACAAGDAEGAARALHSASNGIDALGPEDLAGHLDATLWLGLAEVHLGRYADAIRHLELGLELSRRTGQGHMLVQLHALLGSALVLSGALRPAREHAGEAVEIARLSGVPNLMGWARAAETWSALRAGDLGEALTAGEEVEKLALGRATPPITGGVCALAEARVEAGSADQGRDALLAAYGGPELPAMERAYRPWSYEILTRAELVRGGVDAAADWAARGREAAAVLGLGRDIAWALTAEAAAALAAGDSRRAVSAASEAAGIAGAADSPIQAGRAGIVAGAALAALGERASAIRTVDDAHRRLRACGALRYEDEAARLLRELGRRVPPGGDRRPGHGIAALSPRECEVAQLVTERLTNREIAARLFLSEKTVERHLHRIFGKLGIRSRVELARELERDSRTSGTPV